VSASPETRVVELKGIPLALAARSLEHHSTLMRELALVDAADDARTAHGRLLALSSELRSNYARLGEAQRARAAAAAKAGQSTVDLSYEVPADLADDVEAVQTLLGEVDEFCRGGELVTLVTPADVEEYRRWVFGEFTAQIRRGDDPTPWAGVASAEQTDNSDSTTRPGTIAVDEDLDLEGAARVRDRIARELERGVTDLTFDLERCEFVDSVGISLLLTTLARLRDVGGTLVLVNASDAIRRTLHHAGILDLLVRD
jgi:anti-anti-sigma factor